MAHCTAGARAARYGRSISQSAQRETALAGAAKAGSGATGSGKNLLLRSLVMFDPIDDDEIFLKGERIDGRNIPIHPKANTNARVSGIANTPSHKGHIVARMHCCRACHIEADRRADRSQGRSHPMADRRRSIGGHESQGHAERKQGDDQQRRGIAMRLQTGQDRGHRYGR